MSQQSLSNHDSVNILPNERSHSFMVHLEEQERQRKTGWNDYNYNNGHFRNAGTGTIFCRLQQDCVFYQNKINCPNSFHIDSDGGNIEKFHHPAGDEITLWAELSASPPKFYSHFLFDIKTRIWDKARDWELQDLEEMIPKFLYLFWHCQSKHKPLIDIKRDFSIVLGGTELLTQLYGNKST